MGQIKQAGLLHKNFQVIGITRRDIKKSDLLLAKCRNLSPHLEILKMDVAQAAEFSKLKNRLADVKTGQIILHLSVPPEVVPQTIKYLGEHGLNGPAYKLLLEKPFGSDLASAKALARQISRYFSEDQTYRIDHYLAKEMAQNLTVFAHGNAIFSNIWSRQFIDRIEIDIAEAIGIESRAGFYESTGALRDIVQSHGLQLLALILMEKPSDLFDPRDWPARRLAAIKQLKVSADKTVRGQYAGYRQEAGNPSSDVETFVSLELASRDKRWRAVPIRLTTGKRLDRKLTEIRIYFKKLRDSESDLLTLRIQPREGVKITVWAKEPGYEHRLKKLPLSFNYERHYDRLPEAYEKVLVDVMRSDHNLFASAAEVEACWAVLEPLLRRAAPLKIYQPGLTIEEVLQS